MPQVHPTFKPPESVDARIWRCMDLSKLVSLLSRRELFFVKANKLLDSYEGTVAEYNELARRSVYQEQIPKFQSDEDFNRFIEQMPNIQRRNLEQMREIVLINSWRVDEFESAAMWGLYSSGNTGIAIQSTFGKLAKSFDRTEDVVWIGKVNYLDYKKEWMNEGFSLEAFVSKRKSFEFESELRAVTSLPDDHLYGGRVLSSADKEREAKTPTKKRVLDPKQVIGKGKYVTVDLETLVERVYVDPLAEEYAVDVAKSVVEKYGLDVQVVKSDLYATR